MKNVGIAIDRWKLPIFTRRLVEAGYQFTEHDFTDTAMLLKVNTEDVEALGVVVRASNDEAAKAGKP